MFEITLVRTDLKILFVILVLHISQRHTVSYAYKYALHCFTQQGMACFSPVYTVYLWQMFLVSTWARHFLEGWHWEDYQILQPNYAVQWQLHASGEILHFFCTMPGYPVT